MPDRHTAFVLGVGFQYMVNALQSGEHQNNHYVSDATVAAGLVPPAAVDTLDTEEKLQAGVSSWIRAFQAGYDPQWLTKWKSDQNPPVPWRQPNTY